jgi:hypothetical protein
MNKVFIIIWEEHHLKWWSASWSLKLLSISNLFKFFPIYTTFSYYVILYENLKATSYVMYAMTQVASQPEKKIKYNKGPCNWIK